MSSYSLLAFYASQVSSDACYHSRDSDEHFYVPYALLTVLLAVVYRILRFSQHHSSFLTLCDCNNRVIYDLAMSVASSTASDDDTLMKAIDNLMEPELRAVLQHISLLHPEVVHAALKHQQFLGGFDDMHSVVTVLASNTSKKPSDRSPPPVRGSIHGIAHPSKLRSTDSGDDTMEPRPPKGGSFLRERSGLNGGNHQAPFVPLRRVASPPSLPEESSSRAPALPRKRGEDRQLDQETCSFSNSSL